MARNQDGFVIDGLDVLHRQMLTFVQHKYPRAAQAWSEGLAMRLNERVAHLAPVDNNRLRSSFMSLAAANPNKDSVFKKSGRGANVEVIVGTNVEYADYVNTGHKLRNGVWWEGYHYYDDAWDEFEKEAIGWLEDRLEELFIELGLA